MIRRRRPWVLGVRFGAVLAAATLGAACESLVGVNDDACRRHDLALEVGEVRTLPEADSLCLDLPDREGSYVLAALDIRAVERARRGEPEQEGLDLELFTAAVRDRSSGGSAQFLSTPMLSTPLSAAPTFSTRAVSTPTVAARLPAAHAHGRQGPSGVGLAPDTCPTVSLAEIRCRIGAWQEGERLTVAAPLDRDMVVSLVVPPLVFLEVDGLGAVASAPDVYRGAATAVAERLLPRLRQTFADRAMGSSLASDQLVVLLFDEGDARGSGGAWIVDDAPRGLVWIDGRLSPSVEELTGLLGHEITHVWQGGYMFENGAQALVSAGSLPTGVWWGTEGGAAFVEQELLRELAGLPVDANLDRAAALAGGGWVAAYARALDLRHAFRPGVSFRRGYGASASFFRWTIMRAVQDGSAYDAAVSAVLTGALGGWFGQDLEGNAMPGLTERARPLLGADWDPADALLDWTLASALDDDLVSLRYQDPAVQRAGTSLWPSSGVVELGDRCCASAFNELGAALWFGVEDRVGGGRVVLQAQPGDSIRWAVARRR